MKVSRYLLPLSASVGLTMPALQFSAASVLAVCNKKSDVFTLWNERSHLQPLPAQPQSLSLSQSLSVVCLPLGRGVSQYVLPPRHHTAMNTSADNCLTTLVGQLTAYINSQVSRASSTVESPAALLCLLYIACLSTNQPILLRRQ